MNENVCYVWFQQAVGISNRLVREILLRFDSIIDVYNCNDFSFLGEKREKYIRRLETKDTSEAFEVLKRCEAVGARVTGFYSELYPKKLRAIDNPPAALYSIGEFRDLNSIPCIAVVGTRKMSDYGKNIAERFSYVFAKSGACVVSGLAKGIDTAAHRGAVMADGYTVAVLGNPIGDVYPKENIKAFETLYKRGLVISELYPGAPRTRADFPNRNRIISGICDSVVIAEAGENSGALITAHHAISQGRTVYAVPGAIGAENAGSNTLIKQGIPAVTEPNDVLAPLMLTYPEAVRTYTPSVTERLSSYGTVKTETAEKAYNGQKQAISQEVSGFPQRSEEPEFPQGALEAKKLSTAGRAERILAVLKGRLPLTADEIAIKTGLSINEVLAELTFMEIDGSIISSPGGRFISSKF